MQVQAVQVQAGLCGDKEERTTSMENTCIVACYLYVLNVCNYRAARREPNVRRSKSGDEAGRGPCEFDGLPALGVPESII